MSPHLRQTRRSWYSSRCAPRMWIAEMDKWIKSCCNHSFAYYVYFKLLRRVKEGLRYNIANPRCCTFVQQLALSIFYTLLLKYIRSRLYLIIATTEVIVVPSDQLQTWLLSQCSVLRLFVKEEDVCEVQSSQCVVSSSESKLQDEAQQVLSKSVLLSSRVTSSVKVLLRYGDFMKLLFKCCC